MTNVSNRDASSTGHGKPDNVDERALFRKLDRHVLWLPFLLGFISIIDRVNIGFAKASLSKDLGLSVTQYGFAAGILFLGYFALEVPSNVALRRFGARIWLCRIAVTWGIICTLTAFVKVAWLFYLMRFLLGAAEAGLFPGVVLYLTFWYPAKRRAKAIGIFMACVPVATIFGGPLAGWILGLHNTAGLVDWQWLFLIEGIPAILLGILLIWKLVDGPEKALWLSDSEKSWLQVRLDAETTGGVAGHVRGALRAVLRSPLVWIFTLIYFCYANGQYGLAFFLPSIIKTFGAETPLQVGLFNAIPYAIGTVVMVLVARHSDRTGERRWHLAIPLLIGAIAMLGAGLTLDSPVVSFCFFIVVATAMMTTLGNFWARPTRLLAGTAAAAGIAIINSFGNIGGFVGPYAFGALTDLTGGGSLGGLIFLSCSLLLAAIVAAAIRAGAHDNDDEAADREPAPSPKAS